MPLTAGTIAFVAWNADGADGLAFVATEDLPAGAVIRFNDNEWNGLPVGQGGAFNTDEGSMTWTGPGEVIRSGTVVELLNLSTTSRSASLGTLSGGSLALAASDETVYAYVGDTEQVPSAFLSAITNSTALAGFSPATGQLSGTELLAGTTALALPSSADIAAYAGPTGFPSRAEALAALSNPTNYRVQDGTGDQSRDAVPPDTPFLTDPLSPLSGVAFSFGGDASAVSLVSLQADAVAKAEGLAFTLTVTLSDAAPAGGREILLTLSGAAADIESPLQSVTVPEGQTSASFDLRSIANTVTEADRSLTVTATLEETQREVTVTILDDDRPAGGVLGGIAILPPAESLAGSVETPVASNTLNLVRVGSYLSGSGAGGTESITFDPGSARAYVTNPAVDRIDILDLATPSQPTSLGSIDLRASLPGFSYGEVNSVAVRGGLIAVAIQNADGGEPGVVALFDGVSGALLKALAVGVQPDQLVFSRDGSLLLVANEAERFLDRSGPVPVVENAPGTVTIVSVPQDPASAAVRNTIGFDALDPYKAELGVLGIKTLGATTVGEIAIPDASVSEDLEPEYIAISPDGTRAFATLQEANAVAVIDLTNASADRPLSLLPLGAIDFSLPGNEADFSDRDGPGNTASIAIGNGPIKGLLQPDAIAAFSVAGVTYFATANEGDSRILADATLGDPALNEIRASALQAGAPADYARLNLDTVWSTPGDLYAFGGRGFSVFRQDPDGTITKVEETGGDFDQIVAALPNAAGVFNGENGGAFDTRSDNKGAEPEGIVVGTVGGTPYAFVGLERLGGVVAWDLSNPADARFVRYIPPTSADYGPEVLTFVPAESSPKGRALLLSANEVSGSVTVYEVSDPTRISEIQGSSAASGLVGRTVTVEAIVVGDFQNGDADGARNLGGFFLQEEAADSDGNPLTSEGIFVAQGALPTDVSVGDRVRVTGSVVENFNNTEINATSISVVQAGAVADVTTLAATVKLPTAGVQGTGGAYRADLEAFEGMLVRFAETLTVSEQFNFDQFGEIRLTQGTRPSSFTEFSQPSITGYDAHLRDIASRSVIFDDGRGTSNPNLDNVITDGPYNTATAPRMGDTVNNLIGVLDYDFSQFRVHAIGSGPGINDFTPANPRPAEPAPVGGSLKVATFNVLNYFTTLDDGRSTANGFEPRGAETPLEFARQTEKLVNAIRTLDADILALNEIENNFAEGAPGNALQYLVGQLNAGLGTVRYDWVRPGQQFVGEDAIAVGFIYDRTAIRLAEDTTVAILDDSAVDPALLARSTIGRIFNGENTSRAALAVTFEESATGGEFTAVANHFKSKGGAGTGADTDARDGAGAWNNQRVLAAEALVSWLETNPTGTADPDQIILGDLNAYALEAPIDVLADAGFVDRGAGGYSYVFDGQTGSLDHVLTSASLSDQVTGTTEWHINADEADALDYQLNLNADLATNERNPVIFDPAVPARVSDHDPLIIGLQQGKPMAFALQLLHLSDGEAGLLANETAKNLAALIDRFDDAYANTVILAGGDTFLPGPFLSAGTDPSVIPTLNRVTGSTIAAGGAVPIGAVDTAIHNLLGVQVSAIGNHEFDLGSNTFAASFAPGGGWVGANYALVSANLDFSGDAALNPRFTNTVGDGSVPTALASNLKGRIAPAVVIETGGEKIGVVGATTQLLESLSAPTGTEVKGFPTGPGANGEVDDMALLAQQLQPVIDELRAEGINKIILESHLQVLANERLLGTLLKGVDIILGAGSNTRLGDADDLAVSLPGHGADFADTYPVVITDADGKPTLLVNTDNEYTYLGRLKVDFDANGEVILANLAADSAINGAYAATAGNVAAAWGTSLDALDATAFAAGTKGGQVRDLTDAVQAVIVAKDANVFGYTDVYLEGERSLVRSEETNLGSLSADANAFAFREALGLPAESFVVSFKNGGGIRAQIGTLSVPDPVDGSVDKLPPPANPAAGKEAGGVSLLDVENSLRFDNKLIAFDTTPEGLKALLEHGVAAGTLQGRFPQIGGVSFSWDPDLPAGGRVSDIALLAADGRSLLALYDDGVLLPGAPARISVVTLNFLANGGDGYPAKENGENFRYLLSDGTLSGAVDEALNFTDPGVIAGATPPGTALLGEQQAFGAYLAARYATPETAYALADTPVSLDERIQNLNFRIDTVLAGISGPETGITIGEGPDTLVLFISQDAWLGDAEYVVKVDGVQVGGVLTASALHSSGQSDVVTVRGDWAGGLHGATIEFLNDAWGGTPETDRNLYLDGATYDDVAVPGATAVLEKPGPVLFTFTDTGPVTVPAPVSATIGAGVDSLMLRISQDAYLGAAQYTVAVDGVQINGVLTASATRASGSADTLTVLGNWSGGLHEVTVQFLNDAWDGTPETDRNLYLEGASYNGVALANVAAALDKPVATSFTLLDTGPVGVPVTTTIGTGPDGLVLRISQDAYRGDAAYTVSIDGVQIGGVLTASALRSSGSSDTLNVLGKWGEGVHEARIEFLNDAWDGTPETDRNLFLNGATYDGAAVNGAVAALERPGAAVFTFTDAAISAGANSADLLFVA